MSARVCLCIREQDAPAVVAVIDPECARHGEAAA